MTFKQFCTAININHIYFSGLTNGTRVAGKEKALMLEAVTGVPFSWWAHKHEPAPKSHPNWPVFEERIRGI